MKLIIIDRKAWERHRSEFADFIHSIEQLIGNPPETDEWLDNEAVCKRLGISKRTLQSYRDTGKIPFLNDWTQVLLQGERHHGVTERKQ